jgi:hypothetical protein
VGEVALRYSDHRSILFLSHEALKMREESCAGSIPVASIAPANRGFQSNREIESFPRLFVCSGQWASRSLN